MKQKKQRSSVVNPDNEGNFNFKSIYQKHSSQVMKFLLGRLQNKCDAQDAMQVIWLKVARLLSLFDPSKASLLTWLLNIAACEVQDMMKSSEYRNMKLEGDMLDSHVADHLRYSEPPADNNIDIKMILLKLTDVHREIVTLHYLEGYTQREIADKLDISLAVVNRRINRALAILKEMLSADITAYKKKYYK
jgi:RNA polymerase sigma-70 factor (ECF subfamily)